MKLKFRVKDLDLSTGGPYVAVLNDEDAKELDLHALDRIRLIKGKRHLTVAVDIAGKGIKRNDLGLFEEVIKYLKVKQGDKIELRFDKRPESVVYIKEKLDGKKLTRDKISAIVADIFINNLNVVELTYFVAGFYSNGLSLDESVYLADAIYKNSVKLKFGKTVLNKHCTGGVPGNRTSMVVIPIIAALGYTIPKSSSRAITTASGTADTMEALCPVDLTVDKIKKVVKRTKGCLIWGGTHELASVDNNIINVERLLSLDPVGMLLASILTKQKIMGTSHLLVDIPIDENGKVKTYRQAIKLKAKFMLVGRRLGMKVKVVITDGSQPIGNGVGPVLEIRDVIGVLKGDGPDDLKKKSIELATKLLELIKVRNAGKKVLEVLDNGKAYEKFLDIINAQGGKSNIDLKVGNFSHTFEANRDGVIKEINNKIVNKIVRMLGSPKNKGSGIYFYFKKNSKVRKKDSLFTLYSNNEEKLNYAIHYLKRENILTIK